MGNPLHAMWYRIFTEDQGSGRRQGEVVVLPEPPEQPPSAGVLLVLRRMRAPLIVVIVIFAISVLGLTLVPGEDAQGRPSRLGIFEAFYFMSYTATTIGFGEIPSTFTPAQRMWVTFAIFLSVIGWAYAVGALLALTQDRAFRRELSRIRFTRKVAHLGEPFLLLVGYGNATRRLARSLDDLGRRFVVLDHDENRLARVDLDSYRADTPAVLGDARDTGRLVLAGLGHRHCEGVVVLTGDDETNLDVTMTTSLLRPDLPVVARAHSRGVAERMRTFGAPDVVNPLDRFGDHLRILLRAPSSYRLMVWLTSAPGTPLPPRREPVPHGRWVIGGRGRFGHELTGDLEAEGLEVTVLSADADEGRATADLDAAVENADGFVAATESDVTNLWLVERARLAEPDAFVATLQNHAANAPLFEALAVDFGMELGELIAHEVLARLANPVLMRFLPQVPHLGEEWAAAFVDRLVDRCGTGTPDLWQVRLTAEAAPALHARLVDGGVRLADLLRSPRGREFPIEAVPLALLRGDETVVGPNDEVLLRDGDAMLVAGRPVARRALDSTLHDEPTAAYVVEGRIVPSSWLWRRLSRDATGASSHRG
jgi:voltage-gated potassium channel